MTTERFVNNIKAYIQSYFNNEMFYDKEDHTSISIKVNKNSFIFDHIRFYAFEVIGDNISYKLEVLNPYLSMAYKNGKVVKFMSIVESVDEPEFLLAIIDEYFETVLERNANEIFDII